MHATVMFKMVIPAFRPLDGTQRTTFTATGCSRTVDYENSTYVDFAAASMQVIRQDSDDSFICQSNWIDESASSLQFAYLPDRWSHSLLVPRDGYGAFDFKNGAEFVETRVYHVEWERGQVRQSP